MENQVQAMDDKQAELSQGKQPYAAPALKKLGTVQELTQGTHVILQPDDTVFSA